VRRFEGANVLVTGASRGLGRALAAAFAAEGAFVWIHYQGRADQAAVALEQVRSAGGTGEVLRFDLRQKPQIEEGMRRVLSERGSLDVLVNNAAILCDAPAALLSSEEFDEVLAVNLSGMFTCARAAARSMLGRGKGSIVNVASVAALRATPGQAAYAASKAGVLALTRTLAVELGPRGVRVNAVVPGLFEEGMGARLDRRVRERMLEATPARRFGRPSELSEAVLFLASEQASYVLGHALVVDGGLSL
jgi:3-oxoacyl-[acyl-carrier protein] reductase